MGLALAIGPLVAAVFPLIAMYIVLRQKTDTDYEQELRQRLQDAEQRLAHEIQKTSEQSEEILRLMRLLLKETNGGKRG